MVIESRLNKQSSGFECDVQCHLNVRNGVSTVGHSRCCVSAGRTSLSPVALNRDCAIIGRNMSRARNIVYENIFNVFMYSVVQRFQKRSREIDFWWQ